MGFTTASRPIVSRIQRSGPQLEIDAAVLAAFESGETLADFVPQSKADEVERMIRNGAKLYGKATIVEQRPTDFVSEEPGSEGEAIVEIAFIVKNKRVRKAGEDSTDESNDDVIDESDNDDENANGDDAQF